MMRRNRVSSLLPFLVLLLVSLHCWGGLFVAAVEDVDDDEPTVLEVANLVEGLEYAFDKVIYINDQNFNLVRKKYPRLTINFGQDQCGKCAEFKPFYGHASTVVRRSAGNSDAWAFGYVDIQKSPVLASLFEINMYPLIFHLVEEGVFRFTMTGESRKRIDELVDYFREWDAQSGLPAELGFMDDVITLHDGNWDMVWELSEETPLLFNVYAPWCTHCKEMAPAFARVAEAAEDLKRPWTVVKMDGSKNKEAARQLSVSQYPTLYVFYKDMAYRYTGGHLEREMLNYMSVWRPVASNEIDLRVDEFKDVKEEDVLELDDSTFEFAVEEYRTLCAFFYAPWCGHCKSLHPVYDKAASYLAVKDVPVQMVKVDATTNPEMAYKYNITSYPFVTVIHNGEPYIFRGKRSANGIANYLRYWEPHESEIMKTNEPRTKKIGDTGSRRANNRRVREPVSEPVVVPAEAKVEMIHEEL